jgi:exodeoxyribonuclease-1
MPFVFYDTETTGTSTSFDQILQFAAIRTDENLNELDRFEVRCRLLPHVVPSAGAMLVTGMTIDRLLDPNLPSHHEMICQCWGQLNEWSPATFLGYNSISFDERMLRQAFYQNLHPIYLTNTRGNARHDVLALVRATIAIAPGALAIPTDEETGKPILKLDRLAPANGFAHVNAHDALGDVEATIYICRIVRDRAPDVWRRFLQFSKRANVETFVRGNNCFFEVDTRGNSRSGRFGHLLGSPDDDDRTILYIDLSTDLTALDEMSDEDMAKAITKSPRPVRRFRTNAGPFLLPIADVPDHLLTSLSSEDALRRSAQLVANKTLKQRLFAAALASQKEYPASPHVEEQIYDGFWPQSDEGLMASFHDTPWEERWPLLAEFQDKRLRQLARRLIYFEKPGALPEEQRAKLDAMVAERMLGQAEDTGEWRRLSDTLIEIEELLPNALGDAVDILSGLRDFLTERVIWAKASVGLEQTAPL